MKLDLSKPYDLNRARQYFNKLIKKGAKVELKEYRNQRSLSQNAYLHVLFTIIANDTGYTVEEAKTAIKRRCDFMIYTKNTEKFLRSTTDLDTKEMTDFIDWLRLFSMEELDVYLPTPDEYLQGQFEIEKELEHVK